MKASPNHERHPLYYVYVIYINPVNHSRIEKGRKAKERNEERMTLWVGGRWSCADAKDLMGVRKMTGW